MPYTLQHNNFCCVRKCFPISLLIHDNLNELGKADEMRVVRIPIFVEEAYRAACNPLVDGYVLFGDWCCAEVNWTIWIICFIYRYFEFENYAHSIDIRLYETDYDRLPDKGNQFPFHSKWFVRFCTLNSETSWIGEMCILIIIEYKRE